MTPHPAPDQANYGATYPLAHLPESWTQPVDAEGRPKAHAEYRAVMSHALGPVPPDEQRWERFRDYYFNCLVEVDRELRFLLDELKLLRLVDSTVVVLTSDHGEMQGAHGVRGKGATVYEGRIHVPLVVRAPNGSRGVRCGAVKSHVGLLTTLAGLADLPSITAIEVTSGLPGREASTLVAGVSGSEDAVRDGANFGASRAIYLDGDFVGRAVELRDQGRTPEEIRAELIAPSLSSSST